MSTSVVYLLCLHDAQPSNGIIVSFASPSSKRCYSFINRLVLSTPDYGAFNNGPIITGHTIRANHSYIFFLHDARIVQYDVSWAAGK